MSKLSFRARAVDASKQMPIFLAEELPDLSEYASINRAVPQMPTGMEKDEEMELHLQQAISAQQRLSTGATVPTEDAIIPIPKVSSNVTYYERLYPADYRQPKQLIKIQAALNLEPEIPDYDLDSEDERWLSTNGQKMDITPLQFERVMDTLEKQSEFKVITPPEAKLLLQEDDDMLLAVYDYWLSKRYAAASQGKSLIPRVKTEKRDGTGAKHNPYVAFRRRAEKMQTRKNRRNDEESYEKILKLRHDLQKAVTLAEMVKRREKSKRELINLTLDVVEKRFVLEDFSDELFSQICNEAKPAFRFSKNEMGVFVVNNKKTAVTQRKRKTGSTIGGMEDQGLVSREWLIQNAEEWNQPPASFVMSPKAAAAAAASSAVPASQLDKTAEETDGRYWFKRMRGCRYHAPCSSTSSSSMNEADMATPWPWEEPRRSVLYYPTYLHSACAANGVPNSRVKGVNGLRCIGLARRRIGRGGRMLFDRTGLSSVAKCHVTDYDTTVPSTSSQTVLHQHDRGDKDRSKSVYFRPSSPLLLSELDMEDEYCEPRTSPGPGVDNSTGLGTTTRHSVPFATVVGPNGVLRLPLTIGSIVTPDSQRRNSFLVTTASSSSMSSSSSYSSPNRSTNQQKVMENLSSSTSAVMVQKEQNASMEINGVNAGGGDRESRTRGGYFMNSGWGEGKERNGKGNGRVLGVRASVSRAPARLEILCESVRL